MPGKDTEIERRHCTKESVMPDPGQPLYKLITAGRDQVPRASTC